MEVGGGDLAAPERHEPSLGGLRARALGGEGAKRISLSSSLSSPSGETVWRRRRIDDLLADVDRRRAAGSSRPSRRPRARRAAAAAPSAAPQAGRSTIASATRPPGAQVRGDAAQAVDPLGARRRAAAPAASARGPGRTRAVELEAPGVADDGARSGSARGAPVASAAISSGSRSSPTRPVPAPGEVQGDAAGAAAEVEDRPVGLGRQLLPERQVGAVGAALDVVPDQPRGSLRRSLARTPSPGRGRRAACAARAARCRWAGRRGGPGRRRRRGRARPRSPARPRSSRRGQPAYFSRSAISGARVPAQMTRRTRPAEQLEVGVPDPGDVAPVGDPVVERDPEVDRLAARPRAAACAGPRWRRPGS